jgi:hypothetical protein
VVGGVDCDDFIPSAHPGAPEVPGDGVDNDCNGLIDDVTPTAIAALDGAAMLCGPITVSGAGSYAPVGAPLSYAWSIASRPAGSTATGSAFGSPSGVTTTFTPDQEGVFLVRLTVTQSSISSSDVLLVNVTADPTRSPPVADAGADMSVSTTVSAVYANYTWTCPACPDQVVTLNGTGSTDPDGDAIDFAWRLQSGFATIDAPGSVTTTATLEGAAVGAGQTNTRTYTFELVASDCSGSDAGAVTVTYSCSCF